jgi:hypothetical protein
MRRALRSSTILPSPPLSFLLPLLVVAALTGCGGDDGELQDIASLDTSADASTDTTDATDTSDAIDTSNPTDTTDAEDASDSDGGPGGGSATGPGMVVMQRNASDDPEVQDAFVRYARCMRDHGIDMPDPGAEGQTRIEIDDPDAWEAAEEECRPIIEEVVGTFEPPSEEEQARMREQALEFSKCMREHGIDMPDPEFSEDGGMTINVENDGGEAVPAPDDEEFQAAAEECGGPGGGMFTSAEPAGD